MMVLYTGDSSAGCRHCPNTSVDHKYVCDCGHPHDGHVLFGPCKRRGCSCDGYSQVKKNTVFGKDIRNRAMLIPTKPTGKVNAERGILAE